MINKIFVDHGSLCCVRRQASVAAFENKAQVLVGNKKNLLDVRERDARKCDIFQPPKSPSGFDIMSFSMLDGWLEPNTPPITQYDNYTSCMPWINDDLGALLVRKLCWQVGRNRRLRVSFVERNSST